MPVTRGVVPTLRVRGYTRPSHMEEQTALSRRGGCREALRDEETSWVVLGVETLCACETTWQGPALGSPYYAVYRHGGSGDGCLDALANRTTNTGSANHARRVAGIK